MSGLGITELLLLLMALFAVLAVVVLPGLIIYMVVASNKEWRVEHEGHSIILQNRVFSEKLYLDGQVVDSSSFSLSAVLRGKLDLGGERSAIVEGRIGQGFLGLSIKGRIFVDGRYVGGDPQ